MSNIQLLTIDRMFSRKVSDAMGAHVVVETIQTLDPEMAPGSGVIVIDHASIPADRSLAAVLREVAQQAGGRAVVVATSDLNSAQVLQAIRAGASDIIPRDAEASEISEVLVRVLTATLTSQNRLGRLTLVVGTDEEAGAVYATDVALAHSLAKSQTLLIDCSLPGSTAETYLDLKVDYGLASAVADIDRLDASLLDDALARHEKSGLSLLTLDGGTGAEPVGISPNDIVGLVQLLRATFSNVVICAGSLRNPGLLRELASQAQEIDVVCSQSIRELNTCRRLLERVAPDTSSQQRLRLVVWDYDPHVLLDGRRMADVLGIGAIFTVPHDRTQLRNALNAGRPLLINNDAASYVQAIRRAAGRIVRPRGFVAKVGEGRRAVLRWLERAG